MNSWNKPGAGGAVLYAVAAMFVGSLVTVVSRLRFAKFRGRRRAAELLPPGAIIVVSNHSSYADGLMLAIICRRMGRSLRLLATAGVFRVPGLGGIVRRLGFIPVERGSSHAADALEAAAEALGAGEAVGIFPEGRTTRDPQHWPERAKTGVVRLALRTGAPIIPIAMVGTHRVLTRQHPLRTILTNVVLRPEVLVRVGEPIKLAPLSPAASTPEIVRVLSDQVMAEIVDLVEDLRGELAPSPVGVDPAEG